jgi:UrcA family protein
MLKPLIVAVAILAASVFVVPTVSQAATTNSYRVSYADLNLASKSGQHRLQRRIAFGAEVVCEIEDSRQLGLAVATNECRGDAIAGVQPAYDAAVAAARRGTVEVLGSALIVTAP